MGNGKEIKKRHVTESLPGGWKRRVYLRTSGASAGRKDVVLVSPDDQILRSNVEIERYAKANKTKLNPKVYNVCLATVEHIFKKESEKLIAMTKANSTNSTPKSQTKQKLKENKTTPSSTKVSRKSIKVLAEAAPSNMNRRRSSGDSKADSETSRKRGRPTKTPPSTSRGRPQKRSLSEEITEKVLVSAGRQTRNSLSAIDIPVMSPTIKRSRRLSPQEEDKEPEEEKEEEVVDKEEEEEVAQEEAVEEQKVHEVVEETQDAVEENPEEAADVSTKPMDQEKDKDKQQKVPLDNPKVAAVVEDYNVPLDELELSAELETAAVEKPEEQPDVAVSPEEVPVALSPIPEPEVQHDQSPGVVVVNSKDLSKIDLQNFRFFVLPDGDDELPSDEHGQIEGRVIFMEQEDEAAMARALQVGQELQSKPAEPEAGPEEAEADLKEAEESPVDSEECEEPDTEQELAEAEQDVEEELEEPESEDIMEQTESIHDPNETAAVPASPFGLIYEQTLVGQDPWRLLVAALVQSHEAATVSRVLIVRLLQRFPDASSMEALSSEDVEAMPEFEVVPRLPWLLRRLQRAALRLQAGDDVLEVATQLGGPYARDVWSIFGLGQVDLQTDAFDLATYLRWRRSLD